MLELIKMNKKRVGDFIIGAIAIGLFVSYFFTEFIALPIVKFSIKHIHYSSV